MRHAVPTVVVIALMLEASAIAHDLLEPRRPRSAAAVRAEERSEVKTILMVLVLATPVLAGPADWKMVLHGDAVLPGNTAGTSSGNAEKLEVLADELLTTIAAEASTDIFHADQEGEADDTSTSWYSLEFCGSDEATEHTWRITTKIHGSGHAGTYTVLESSAYAESLQIIEFCGDHANAALGQLAVDDSSDMSTTLSIPFGFSVTLAKGTRSQEEDDYRVEVPRATAGDGKVCRVRADALAHAKLGATGYISTAGAWICDSTELKADLTMTGTCRYRGLRVEDTFQVAWEPHSPPSPTVTPPEGGIEEEDPGEIPTDTPTDAEREGEDDGPTVDAGDLPDEDGGDAVEPGDPDEEDGGDGQSPDTGD